MSIINQTLRELDARKQRVPVVTPHPAPPIRPRRRLRLWAAGGVVVLLAAAGAAWVMLGANDRRAPSPPIARTPVAAAVTVAPAAPVALPSRGEPVSSPRALPAPANSQPLASRPVAEPAAELQAPAPAQSLPIRKEIHAAPPEDEADTLYRKAESLLKKGRDSQVKPMLEEALRLAPAHVAARQMLATLLSEAGRDQEAEAVLRAGVAAVPDNAWFALGLARLQANRGDADGAAATLAGGLDAPGVTAEYRATLAALYLRLKRYPDATVQYGQALRAQPGEGKWWLGLGLSLDAQGKAEEANRAYAQAIATATLPDSLLEFARAKLAD